MTERVAIRIPGATRRVKVNGQIVEALEPDRTVAYAVIGEPPDDIPEHYREAGAEITAAIRARIARGER